MRMKRFAALALVALVAAPAASAKNPANATVCGASGCHAGDASRLTPVSGGFAIRNAPRPARYYAIFIAATGRQPFCWRMIWVPQRRLLRVENLLPYVPGAPVAGRYWRTVDARFSRDLASSVRGLRPYAATRAWRAPSGHCRG
jgi:hypothetical protein